MNMRTYRCLEENMDFDLFRSEMCHMLKAEGDIGFLENILKYDIVGNLYNKQWYAKAFYTLAIFDYITAQLNSQYYTGYEKYRGQKLKYPVFPTGILLKDKFSKADEKQRAIDECKDSPVGKYFYKYNIIERDIRDVV